MPTENHHPKVERPGEYLRRLRVWSGFSIPTVAGRVGTSKSAWSELEKGQRTTILGVTPAKIAEALRIHPMRNRSAEQTIQGILDGRLRVALTIREVETHEPTPQAPTPETARSVHPATGADAAAPEATGAP